MLSGPLHDLTRDSLALRLLGQQLLVEGVLLLADGCDAFEVVHVSDRTWAATLEVISGTCRCFHAVVGRVRLILYRNCLVPASRKLTAVIISLILERSSEAGRRPFVEVLLQLEFGDPTLLVVSELYMSALLLRLPVRFKARLGAALPHRFVTLHTSKFFVGTS